MAVDLTAHSHQRHPPASDRGWGIPTINAMTQRTIAEAADQVRRLLAPEPYSYGAVCKLCRTCGAEFWRDRQSKTRYCPRCSYDRHVDGTQGISRREGPAWEATVRGQLKRWLTEAERLGLTPEDVASPNVTSARLPPGV
jgi:predicted Zn-ribbon and HTH transcriptional regulator